MGSKPRITLQIPDPDGFDDEFSHFIRCRRRLSLTPSICCNASSPNSDSTAELDRLPGHLTDLVGRINRSNLAARLPNGTGLTDALAAGDTLALRAGILVFEGGGTRRALRSTAWGEQKEYKE